MRNVMVPFFREVRNVMVFLFFSDGYFRVSGPTDREPPGLFGDRARKAHIASYRPRFATVFLPLERGDRELSIRAKIVENGAIELGIWAL